MKKFNVILIFILTFILSMGCTNKMVSKPTISPNSDSEYMKTFKDLGLGILYDFEFTLPNANKSWVNVWVERYNNGKKETHPLTQLSYGLSPNDTEEGHFGFAMLHPNSDETEVFLYTPGIIQHPKKVEQVFNNNFPRAWGYAIGDEKTELKLGETYVLGVYRQSSEKDSIRTYDFQDEDAVKQMIKEDRTVILLKIKVDEKNNDK